MTDKTSINNNNTVVDLTSGLEFGKDPIEFYTALCNAYSEVKKERKVGEKCMEIFEFLDTFSIHLFKYWEPEMSPFEPIRNLKGKELDQGNCFNVQRIITSYMIAMNPDKPEIVMHNIYALIKDFNPASWVQIDVEMLILYLKSFQQRDPEKSNMVFSNRAFLLLPLLERVNLPIEKKTEEIVFTDDDITLILVEFLRLIYMFDSNNFLRYADCLETISKEVKDGRFDNPYMSLLSCFKVRAVRISWMGINDAKKMDQLIRNPKPNDKGWENEILKLSKLYLDNIPDPSPYEEYF